ncbi:M23 family metallopeptidase [Nocardioides sp. BP30]|uniref:murein hydrolase activator EnvC family protein n=1 Tax=Nocardioides sp. BP30 TaxID=3036374 RepID=UPI00246925E1|nr:M23 family metallopeptidase [Nocardioides sp. BP30]WGL53721.1 M23 family metallopeptidase [Nocardioides sp. BP30]
MKHSTTDGIRLPGVRLLAVLTIVLLALAPLRGRAAVAGDAGAAVPIGRWPLQPTPRVVRAFDPPSTPWGAGHRGVDLAAGVGQAVLAALPGHVTFAGSLAGRGVVVVDHGAFRTTYEPVAAGVAVGDVVPAGAMIGTVTLLRSHCLPSACLHWGLVRNSDGAYLDPLQIVGLGEPVRLLPWQGGDPHASAIDRVPARPVPLPYATWRPPSDRMPIG